MAESVHTLAKAQLIEAGEIYIPVIEIVPGWSVESLETIEDCEDAHIKCSAIIAEIEYQIDIFETLPVPQQDLAWLARAKRALKYKKLALQCVNNCRARIAKEEKRARDAQADRKLIEIIKASAPPDQWRQWIDALAANKQEGGG